MKQLFYFLLFTVLCLFFVEAQATVRYVRPSSHGAGNGSSWANASNDLQLMINQSAAGDTIFVAEGTYIPRYTADGYNAATSTYPYTDGGRDNAFVLKANVIILGGFPDMVTATLANRDWNSYPTILSGQRGNNPNSTTNNCYHVVISSGDVGTACLDGFIITKGRTPTLNIIIPLSIMVNGYAINVKYGGGLYITYSSPKLMHLNIENNWAWYGGGIYNSNSYPVLTNVIIAKNTGYRGGGIYNGNSSFVLIAGMISENSALSGSNGYIGGGIFNTNYSFTILTNVVITKNYAGSGSGIRNDNSSSLILTNVLIVKNIADYGAAGIAHVGSTAVLTNVTISSNHITDTLMGGDVDGGGIWNWNLSSCTIRNSIIWGNTRGSRVNNIENRGTIIYQNSLIGGEPIGNGIILNKDPLFVDTANDNYRLNCYSPAVNSGSNTFYNKGNTPDLSAITIDLDSNLRINGTVDLGAYEHYETI